MCATILLLQQTRIIRIKWYGSSLPFGVAAHYVLAFLTQDKASGFPGGRHYTAMLEATVSAIP